MTLQTFNKAHCAWISWNPRRPVVLEIRVTNTQQWLELKMRTPLMCETCALKVDGSHTITGMANHPHQEIHRPRQIYTGASERAYVRLVKRP